MIEAYSNKSTVSLETKLANNKTWDVVCVSLRRCVIIWYFRNSCLKFQFCAQKKIGCNTPFKRNWNRFRCYDWFRWKALNICKSIFILFYTFYFILLYICLLILNLSFISLEPVISDPISMSGSCTFFFPYTDWYVNDIGDSVQANYNL